jgi:hypothetical protein
MGDGNRTVIRRDEMYWAREEDPTTLASNLKGKIEAYGEIIRDSHFLRRIVRNWKYYHGLYFNHGDGGSTEVKQLGENGEIAGLAANHHRNLLQHLLTITTATMPSYAARASNSDQRSIDQARLGTQILDYYMHARRLSIYLKNAVEHALVLSTGYLYAPWNPSMGKEKTPDLVDEATGEFMWDGSRFDGDIEFSNPTFFDVVHDPHAREWTSDVDWVIIRKGVNRWDLAAKYPEEADYIASFEESDGRSFDFRIGSYSSSQGEFRDKVNLWEFLHRRTDGLPDGRQCFFLGDKILGPVLPIPYPEIPLYQCTPSRILMSTWGYSPGFDLQGLQEAINNQLSTILSNSKSFGMLRAWVKSGQPVQAYQIDQAFALIESDEKPEVLNMLQESPSLYKALEVFISQAEYISGVNSVARGQPEASLRTGTALALVDSKAIQFASGLIQSFYNLLEDCGTGILKTLKNFSKGERTIALLGLHNQTAAQRSFQGSDLDKIERVIVETTSPIARSFAGRLELANNLKPWIKNAEEYLTVVNAGTIEPMLEAETRELALIRDENERLLLGESVEAMATDNHLLHIRENGSILSNVDVRRDENRTAIALSHLMQHVQASLNPQVQLIQTMLGNQAPAVSAPTQTPDTPPSRSMTGGMPPTEPQPGMPTGDEIGKNTGSA